MKVALIGSNGTLATAFGKYCNQKDTNYMFMDALSLLLMTVTLYMRLICCRTNSIFIIYPIMT